MPDTKTRKNGNLAFLAVSFIGLAAAFIFSVVSTNARIASLPPNRLTTHLEAEKPWEKNERRRIAREAREPQPAGQRWIDPEGRFSIVFPDDWSIDPSQSTPEREVSASSAAEFEGDFPETVLVARATYPTGYTQDDYIREQVSVLSTAKNFQELDRGDWKQDGNAGLWMEFTAVLVGNVVSHNFVFLATEPGQLYVISCASLDADFPRWKDRLRQIAESFRLE